MGLGWSKHRNGAWRGQYDRTFRWYERTVRAASEASGDVEDFSYAFFQNCYHLREWMLLTGGASQQELEDLFAGSPGLRLCRDICNGTKHFNIDRPSVDANFSVLREYAPSEPSSTRLLVIADSRYDLLELAHRCMEAWRQFVDKREGASASRVGE
jgi:hypothetical protein